jgi:hypothetical protein
VKTKSDGSVAEGSIPRGSGNTVAPGWDGVRETSANDFIPDSIRFIPAGRRRLAGLRLNFQLSV